MRFLAYYRAHGSFLVPFVEAAANFLGSKPVMEGRAIVMELRGLACGLRANSGTHQLHWNRRDLLIWPLKQLERARGACTWELSSICAVATAMSWRLRSDSIARRVHLAPHPLAVSAVTPLRANTLRYHRLLSLFALFIAENH
jgi:hypothetical protein